MASLKEHYEWLRETNLEKSRELDADLALQGYYSHFRRSVLAHPAYNLRKVGLPLAEIIIKHMPWFTAQNFKENTLPSLPNPS